MAAGQNQAQEAEAGDGGNHKRDQSEKVHDLKGNLYAAGVPCQDDPELVSSERLKTEFIDKGPGDVWPGAVQEDVFVSGKIRVQDNRRQHELGLGELHGMLLRVQVFIRQIADRFRPGEDVLQS